MFMPHMDDGYLDGQLLIAMPGMQDTRFARSVIYLCAHSSDGAMGLSINQPAERVTLNELLVQLDIISENERITIPDSARHIQINRGGPVETGRGFVLHSDDYFSENATLPIDDGIALTATVEILRDIADGRGPASAILALGYAGWAPGQLESEIRANGWLHCSADADIVFARDPSEKYGRALARLGIDPGRLSDTAGHA